MDITQELTETVDLDAQYKGSTINFKVAKSSMTPSFMQGIERIADYPKAVAGCVREWDVTAKGDPYPLTEDALARLPVKLLSTLLDRISESWTGEKKSEKASASGSAATAS